MKAAPFASLAVFAEDIRPEEQGQITIVGVLPDNLAVDIPTGETAALPKLAVLVRSSFDVDEPIRSELTISLLSPGGRELANIVTSITQLEEEVSRAIAKGTPLMSMNSRIIMAPFPLELGRFTVTSAYGSEVRLAGLLNVSQAEAPQSVS